MGHPLIDEFCRSAELQPHFIRRCQRVFREEVQPMLDERERLLEQNEGLKHENERLKKSLESATSRRKVSEVVPA